MERRAKTEGRKNSGQYYILGLRELASKLKREVRIYIENHDQNSRGLDFTDPAIKKAYEFGINVGMMAMIIAIDRNEEELEANGKGW